MNWDDIKIFLEVARCEKLSQASKRLSMDTSTVSRRLHKLEESLKTQLFERTVDGHHLTSDGQSLLTSARRMEQDALQALDTIAFGNQENKGSVRIGVTEAFGSFFVAPNLLSLKQQLPDIDIDLLHFSRFVKISRNEADIAIAVEKPKSTSMIVTKLCDYKLQLYSIRSYLTQNGITVEDEQSQLSIDKSLLTQLAWVTYVDKLLFTDELSYVKELDYDVKTSFRSTSITSQYNAIKSGLGVGILPCFMAEQDPSLVKLCPESIAIIRSFYLVTHPESKRLSRVTSVWEYLKDLAKQHQALLMP